MKILAIDSSALVASVAIVEDEKLLAEYTVNHKKTHSQTLMPMVEEVCRMCEVDLHTLDAVAVAGGPGSFTGLRIGSASAKGIAYALSIPIVQVPTLEAMAYNLWGSERLIVPIMDARRDQVYTGAFRLQDNGCPLEILKSGARSIHELTDWINEKGESVIFLGDGVFVFKNTIEEALNVKYEFAPPHKSLQSAASVASLAFIYYNSEKKVTAFDHKPVYMRQSQAERVRSERQGLKDAADRPA